MLPSEIPWVLYEGGGDRGPFPLSVDGVPISFADKAHIRATRFDSDGVPTVLVEGTDYQLSANSALPDLNDVSRTVVAASATLKVVQSVLSAGEVIKFERIAPASQDLSYTQASGFNSSASERNLDAIVRVIQQLVASMSRVLTINSLDDDGALELPIASERANTLLGFDDNGDPIAREIEPGIGDMLSDNNLSDVDNPATARANLGLNSAALQSESAFLKVANNLSDGNASSMRSNLGLGSVATATLDTDGTLAANSDTRVSSQKGIKTYIDTAISNLRNGVAAAYDTLSEIVTAFASIGPVTKSVIETGSAVALTTDTPTNVTSITIPSDGDYDFWGAIHFKGGSSRTIGYLLCSISSSSATLNTAAERSAAFYYSGSAVFAGVSFITVPLQEFRLTGLTAGTVIYLVPQAGFGGSGTTVSAYGSLYARKRGL